MMVHKELSVLPNGNPSSLAKPFSLMAAFPMGRKLIESKKASLPDALLRVASNRTRIQLVPGGAVLTSSVKRQSAVEVMKPESSTARMLVLVASRYSTIIRATSGEGSSAERK